MRDYEKYLELAKEYPDVFGDYRTFDCGIGWYSIIKDLAAELHTLQFTGQVRQIKEKFGRLCFYVGSATDEQFAAIDRAEAKSVTICEWCGAPGKMTSAGWMRTLCDTCHEIAKQKLLVQKEHISALRKNIDNTKESL